MELTKLGVCFRQIYVALGAFLRTVRKNLPHASPSLLVVCCQSLEVEAPS